VVRRSIGGTTVSPPTKREQKRESANRPLTPFCSFESKRVNQAEKNSKAAHIDPRKSDACRIEALASVVFCEC
jgi:hypothetical protein